MRISILFYIVAKPIYIPTNCLWGFSFLHILPAFFICCHFDNILFWQVWGSIALWLWYAFPWWLVMFSKHIFMYLYATCCLLWKKKFRSSAHFVIVLFLFLAFSCMSYLYILDINTLLNILFKKSSFSVEYLFIFYFL